VALKGLCATGWVVSSSPASHGAVGRLRGSAARVWLQEDWEEVKRYRHPYRKAKADPKGVMPWRILRLTEQGRRAVDGGIVIEEPLEIRLDGRTVAVLMRSPGMEKELAAGFCLGEGLVAGLGDIALIRHCGRAVPDELANDDPLDESRNRVDVTLMAGVAGGPMSRRWLRIWPRLIQTFGFRWVCCLTCRPRSPANRQPTARLGASMLRLCLTSKGELLWCVKTSVGTMRWTRRLGTVCCGESHSMTSYW
jgi:hypothetical protein